MIPFQCECGRKFKLKDEMAGRKGRCPDCSQTFKVPAAEVEDDFLADIDDEEEAAEELPQPRSRSKKSASKSTKKPSTKKSRSSAGSGITAKKIFGGLSLVMGVLILGVMAFLLFSGDFEPKRLRGLIFPFCLIGMGVAWMKGETFGG